MLAASCGLFLHVTVHAFCPLIGIDYVFSAWSLLSACHLLKLVFTISIHDPPFLTQPTKFTPNMNKASLSHHFGHYSYKIVSLLLT